MIKKIVCYDFAIKYMKKNWGGCIKPKTKLRKFW